MKSMHFATTESLTGNIKISLIILKLQWIFVIDNKCKWLLIGHVIFPDIFTLYWSPALEILFSAKKMYPVDINAIFLGENWNSWCVTHTKF